MNYCINFSSVPTGTSSSKKITIFGKIIYMSIPATNTSGIYLTLIIENDAILDNFNFYDSSTKDLLIYINNSKYYNNATGIVTLVNNSDTIINTSLYLITEL
jgi:hypothetical protein